jgi:peptidoglycan/xylan/chitin deacetylase (PgdA/CDA1 family)
VIGIWILAAVTTQTPIITYHDVIAKRTKDSLWFDCSINEFEAQINWLKKKGARFVSTTDVVDSLYSHRPLPRNAVCICFADNYSGFYKYAWPILKREKIPTTQFVHTGFVGSPVGRRKMTWKQLVELDHSGLVTIASQTVSHPADLTKMSSSAVLLEFAKSRRTLAAKLGHEVTQLAYPNGKYDSRVSALAKQAGYRAAFTEDCQPAERARNFFQIARYVHTKVRAAWLAKGA